MAEILQMLKKLQKELLDYTYNFDYETTIIDNYYTKVTVKLEHVYNYNIKSKLNLVIKNNKAVDVNLGDFGNILEEINKVINFNLENIKSGIELSFSNGMANGSVQVIFYLFLRKIEIYAGSKITKNHHSYRGGYTITIYLKDHFDELGERLLEPCKVFVKRFGIVAENIISAISNLVNEAIKLINEVINYIKIYFPILVETFLSFIVMYALEKAEALVEY